MSVESRSGFSRQVLLNRTNFNPWIGFAHSARQVMDMKPPVIGTPQWFSWSRAKSPFFSAADFVIQNYAIRNLGGGFSWANMGSKRIGETQVKIVDCRRAGNEPRYSDWIGTATVNGEEKTFTADRELESGAEYWVVYERFEVLPGSDGVRIHSIIEELTK